MFGRHDLTFEEMPASCRQLTALAERPCPLSALVLRAPRPSSTPPVPFSLFTAGRNDRRRDGDRIPVRPGTRDERVRLPQGAADCFDRILGSIGVARRARRQPGAYGLPDVATNPVVANGGRGHRDWPETVELVSAASWLGLSPGKKPALAPCLPINLSSGDWHDFATQYARQVHALSTSSQRICSHVCREPII
jgi:hypothetical protein